MSDRARLGTGREPAADYLPQLQKELIAVISKYVNINADDIKVNLERQDSFEVLEVKIEMPSPPGQPASPPAA